MFVVNIRALQELLATARLSSSQVLRYLIGFLIFGPAPAVVLYLPVKSLPLIETRLLASCVIPILGATYCSRRNHEASAFLERFVAVGFVVAVRFAIGFALAFCIGMLTAGIYLGATGVNVAEHFPAQANQAWLGLAVYSTWHLLYFWRVGVRLSQIPATSP